MIISSVAARGKGIHGVGAGAAGKACAPKNATKAHIVGPWAFISMPVSPMIFVQASFQDMPVPPADTALLPLAVALDPGRYFPGGVFAAAFVGGVHLQHRCAWTEGGDILVGTTLPAAAMGAEGHYSLAGKVLPLHKGGQGRAMVPHQMGVPRYTTS